MNISTTYNSLNGLQRILVTLILAIAAYSLSTGVSYTLFSQFKQTGSGASLISSLPGPASTVDEDPNQPKTEQCPLDGGMHTTQARDAWEKRRPLAVMIENHAEARQQSGLS